MAFTNVPYEKRISDVIVDQYPDGGYNFDNANITPAGVIPLGTIVFRAKSQDVAAAWATGLVAADLVTTNEFALVYGDGFSFKADFTPVAIAGGRYNAVVMKRGPATLKEFYIKAAHSGLNAAQLGTLKSLLAAQGIVVLDGINA
jgi:hypothetical protein